MKIMAIGAHPDDIEIFMYGLLFAFKSRGDILKLLIATDGAAGTIKNKLNLIKIRKQETLQGLKNLGKPIFLNLPDGKLSQIELAKSKIDAEIKKFNPDLIITHAPEDYHNDHRSLSSYVNDITGFHCPVIYCETLLGVNFIPSYYIDITRCFHFKKEAILKHSSQNPHKFLSAVELTNQFRAAQCNHPTGSYAEVYRYDNKFPFADIRSLLPNAPDLRPYYNNNINSLI